jgi:hypothetical protein
VLRHAAALALVLVAPTALAPKDVPDDLRPALLRAERAIQAAACEVERRFGEGDPDANAASCDSAVQVPGVRVGRTSARLRNPRNAPPEWAHAHVAATDGEKATAVDPAVFDLGDRVGLLRPIEIRRRCLSCHAGADALSPGTRAWLHRAYPEDRALDYALGDLRGFWWAEAPKVETPSRPARPQP